MKRLDEITASELRTETRIRGSIETARVACLLGMASLMLGGAAAPAVAQVPTTPPTFYKVFSPDAIGPGSTTRLIFTIDNTNATNAITTSPLSDLAFTDVLPSEITIATPASATTDCAGALLTAPEGGGTITMTDGRLGADSLCTVEVNVTSDVIGEGPYTNVSGDLTSSAGNHGDAEADLTVDGDRPGFSKAFSPSSIPLLGTSTLTFTIDNPVAGSLLGIFAFSDVLPPGMTLADPSNATTTCSGSGFSLGEPESRTIFFTGGSLSAGSSCTASIDVTTDTGGTFENVSSELEFGSSSTDTSSGFATAALEVPIEFLNKAFVNDPVPPGGQVDLRFTIVNPSRTDAATGIAFDDDLTFLTDLTAVGLPLTEACDPDGPGGSPGTGTLSGTTFLSFSGGSLPPEGSCTFSVPLSVDPDSNPDTYINTTSAVTATIGGDAVTGNVATDELTVSFVPTFTKEFLDNPVGAGGTTTLRFTITNTSPGDSLDDIAFTDVFDEVLPTASVVPSNPVCNGGTAVFTPLISSGSTNNPARFAVIGASLDPSESCTIELTLDVVAGAADGTYPNATSTITGLLGGEEPVEGLPASDDLVIVGGPSLIKEFTDDPVAPGGTVILEFTLSHDEWAPGDATDIAFNDDLHGLEPRIDYVYALGLPLDDVCNGTGRLSGTGIVPQGVTLLVFSGGILAPGESCSFPVELVVPAGALPGPYTNTTSAVTALVDGVEVIGNAAIDDLRIAGLTLTKEFLDDPVIPGETVTLEFVIENLHPTLTATSITIKDDMATILGGSPDITAVDGSPVFDVCGTGNGTVGWSSGDTFMTFSGGTLAPTETCTFSVVLDVPPGAASGTYVNTTGTGTGPGFTALMPSPDFISFPEATDDLVVNNIFIDLDKEFTDDPVESGGTANLRFTLTNLSSVEAITDIAFDDDLNAALLGLEAVGPLSTGTCDGTLTGTGFLDYSGGTLDPSETCFFDVTVSVPALPAGTLAVNTTSGVTGLTDPDDLPVVGDPATDTLRIGSLTLAKSFDGPTRAGRSVELTFTLTNLGDATAGDLSFSDDLDAVVPGLVATGLPVAACGGTLITPDGGATIILVGGSLAAAGSPGDSCSIPVTLDVPVDTVFGTYTNTSSDLEQRGVSMADPAVADLEIEWPIDFSKAFLPDTIGPGSTAELRFDIGNPSDALAEDVAFSDVLPAGVVIATPSSAFTDCTDGVLSAPDGGTTISLTGARVGMGTSCVVTVNVTAAAAGEYDNVSGDLTSTVGSGGTATATLTVDADRPGFSKSFAPGAIPPGGVSTLTFTIDNSASDSARTFLSFLDALPAGLVVASPSNAASDCDGEEPSAVLTAVPGGNSVSLALGYVGAGSMCTVSVDVTAAGAGLYENISGELTSVFEGEVSSGFATAELDVRKGFLVKAFTDDPVPPGSTVTLAFEINNPSRDFPATDIAFTDDLDTVLTGLTVVGPVPTEPCGGGSSLTVEPANVLTLSGGSLPAEGSCTFSVVLQLPPASDGTYTNTTSEITATIDGATEIGDPATDVLEIVAAPVLVKEFLDADTLLPDPVVGAGDDVVIRFTISNTSTAYEASSIAFTDELTTFLPFPVSVTLPPVPDPPCGLGSTFAVTSCGTDCQQLELVGGSLDSAPGEGSTCAFDVTLSLPDGFPAGTYLNTTSEITAFVNDEVVSGVPASDTFDVVAPPRLTKEFLDDPVQPGETVTLEFTLEHEALAPGDATDIEFTDNLAMALADMTAGGLPLADVCGPGNGTLEANPAGTLLTFSGSTLTPGEICTFSVILTVPVTATAGTYTNTTSNVVATVLGVETVGNPAEAELMVGGLVMTKEFTDDPVIAGGTVTLEFVITNDSPDDFVDIGFTDDLDPTVLAGLSVLTAPLPTEPCGPGSSLFIGTAVGVDELLGLQDGSLASGTSCVFSVELEVPLGTPSGTYVNRTSNFGASIDEGSPGDGLAPEPLRPELSFPNASDELVVANEQLLLTKEFIDDPVVPGGTVTLEFGFSTLGISDEAAALAFTDDLEAALAGLVAVPPFDTGSCGGTLTGTSVLDYSGGSLSGGECAFSVTVEVPSGVPFGTTITNTTSEATGTIDDLPVTGEPAVDDLLIDFFIFTKSFDGPTTPTGTPLLSFYIENLSTTDTVADLSFSDDLDAVVPGLVATSLPAEPCGVGSSISGTSVLTMTGGTLLPGGSCTFDVVLLLPPDSGGGTFTNTTSSLFVAAVPAASPATAELDVEPPPVFGKAFIPDVTIPGGRSGLTFMIDNTSTFPVTDLAFTDTLPAGLTVAFSADVGTNCLGGVLTAPEGGNLISFSGGELLPGEFCLIQVDVTGAVPGAYVNTSSPLTSSSGVSNAAIDTLIIIGSGEPCPLPAGDDLTIADDTFTSEQEFVVCNTITVGPNVGVQGPDGHLILRAGVAIEFLEGVVIDVDGRLTAGTESVLIP